MEQRVNQEEYENAVEWCRNKPFFTAGAVMIRYGQGISQAVMNHPDLRKIDEIRYCLN